MILSTLYSEIGEISTIGRGNLRICVVQRHVGCSNPGPPEGGSGERGRRSTACAGTGGLTGESAAKLRPGFPGLRFPQPRENQRLSVSAGPLCLFGCIGQNSLSTPAIGWKGSCLKKEKLWFMRPKGRSRRPPFPWRLLKAVPHCPPYTVGWAPRRIRVASRSCRR